MNFYENNKKLIIVVAILMLIAIAGKQLGPNTAPPAATVSVTPISTSTASSAATSTVYSDGIISFYIPENFALALNADQILAKSYIPPCENGFDYCLYYVGTTYFGTNFGSAGIRIKNRADLKTASECLGNSPESFPGLKSATVASTTAYKISFFEGIGDAAMGHYALGQLYRVAYEGTCHEFETRVSATRFENYPAGTVKEFDAVHGKALLSELRSMLLNIALKSGEKISL